MYVSSEIQKEERNEKKHNTQTLLATLRHANTLPWHGNRSRTDDTAVAFANRTK